MDKKGLLRQTAEIQQKNWREDQSLMHILFVLDIPMYEITLQVLSIENINKKISQDGRKVCYLNIALWMGFVWFYLKNNCLFPANSF